MHLNRSWSAKSAEHVDKNLYSSDIQKEQIIHMRISYRGIRYNQDVTKYQISNIKQCSTRNGYGIQSTRDVDTKRENRPRFFASSVRGMNRQVFVGLTSDQTQDIFYSNGNKLETPQCAQPNPARLPRNTLTPQTIPVLGTSLGPIYPTALPTPAEQVSKGTD
jgi:hypothetical protein